MTKVSGYFLTEKELSTAISGEKKSFQTNEVDGYFFTNEELDEYIQKIATSYTTTFEIIKQIQGGSISFKWEHCWENEVVIKGMDNILSFDSSLCAECESVMREVDRGEQEALENADRLLLNNFEGM